MKGCGCGLDRMFRKDVWSDRRELIGSRIVAIGNGL